MYSGQVITGVSNMEKEIKKNKIAERIRLLQEQLETI
jgi:hypothetical protein